MPHAEHDQACRAPLELHCFGPFLVLRDRHQVTAWERPAARELLAYLVLHGRRGVSPDQLKEALWPDKSPEAGDRLLWPRLSQARKAIGDEKERPFIHFSAGLYRLDADRVWSDVWAFDDAVARARRLAGAEQEAELARAAELYTGELFADHCPDWAVELQEEYRARALDALNRIAAIAFRRGDPGAAARSYRRALALDPMNEEVATNLARMLHQLGDRSGLIRLRASLTDALRRELDDPEAEPQPETAAVFGAALADLETRSSGSASTPRRA
jgi:two-component SAPR family response regulator